jgi:hypothetical protein
MKKERRLTRLQQEQIAKRELAIEYIKQHPSMSNSELIKRLGVSERSVRRYKQEAGISTAPTPAHKKDPKEAVDYMRCRAAYEDLRDRYDKLLHILDEKDAMLSQYADLSGALKNVDIAVKNPDKREAVPVIVASDWHIEETVTAAITNGLNEYNLTIAEDSIKQFFNNAIYLVNNLAKRDSKVNTVVLAILGDIINGVLREEDLETNQVTPIEATMLARSFIYSGIKLLAEKTGCDIKVICCVGNHGRLTEKINYSNQIKNSLDYLMYKTLERDFRDHQKVDFHVPESPYTIQRIFDVRVRFQHGHAFHYHGGIGGLGVPVLRKIAQLNTIEPADLDVLGHFHSTQTFGKAIINGSLVGSNGYSMSLGLPHEPPQQTFFMIDSKYGRTIVTPIFIDRDMDKTEGDVIR